MNTLLLIHSYYMQTSHDHSNNNIYYTGHVASLQKNVSSQYADGIFIQHQDSFGNIYNV